MAATKSNFLDKVLGRIGRLDAEGLQTALSVDGISPGWASKLLAIDPKNQELVEGRCEAAVQMVRSARGRVEAAIDFPEAAEEQSGDLQDAEKKLLSVKSALSDLLTSYYQFSKTAGEPRVAIVGAPNAGKSTLLNALLGSERSIVSQVAGTTRDVVEVRVKLPSGRWIRLLDTAGLRADAGTEDSAAHFGIEKRGMELGLEAAEFANIVIWVSDSRFSEGQVGGPVSGGRSISPNTELAQLKSSMARKKMLVELHSHADLSGAKDKNSYNFNNLNQGEKRQILSELDSLLERELAAASVAGDFDLVISRRQGQLLEIVEVEVDRALQALRGEKPIELCGEFLREAETLLCRMTAKGMGEAYIEEIFRQFCLGK
jgi:tRNA modification GTPase